MMQCPFRNFNIMLLNLMQIGRRRGGGGLEIPWHPARDPTTGGNGLLAWEAMRLASLPPPKIHRNQPCSQASLAPTSPPALLSFRSMEVSWVLGPRRAPGTRDCWLQMSTKEKRWHQAVGTTKGQVRRGERGWREVVPFPPIGLLF
jgi:hypothetical protein